jgi:hypothetical protein
MPDPRSAPDDRPNIGSEPLEEELRTLAGEEPADEQDGALDLDEVATRPELTPSELDYGAGITADPEAWEDRAGTGDVVSLDALVDSDLRDGETDNPLVAIEEGMTYVPPSDPPVVPSDDPEGVEVPGSPDTDGAESDVNARIREALRADGATSALADRLEIAVIGSTAIIRGQVDGIEDGDALVEVASQVDGIEEVLDQTEVAGLA